MLFEHKSYPDRGIGFQLLRYIVRVAELHFKQHPENSKFPLIFSMALYHGEHQWNIPNRFQALMELANENPLKAYIPEFRFEVYDISHLSDEEIKGKAMARIVLLILKHIFRPDLRAKLPEILSLFRNIADRNTALEILEILLRYVVQVKQYREQEIGKILKETDMGDDIMQTFIDKYIDQGMQQGLRQGLLRIFRKQMEFRFGRLPEWAIAKIEQASPDMIEKWGIHLLTASSLEDVLTYH